MLLLIILTAIRIADYSPPCLGYRRFSSVVIHDPTDVFQYFSDMIHTENRFRKKKYAQWSVEEVKEKCFHAIVDGALFVIVKQKDDRDSESYDFDRRLFHTLLHKTFLLQEGEWKFPSVEAVSREVTTSLGVPAHYCVTINKDTGMEQFAIASAHHHDALFLLRKKSNDWKYKIFAIVEPIPKFDLQTLRKKDLETAYLTGNVFKAEERQETVEESEEDDFSFENSYEDDDLYHHVCELDEFRKHRLCATAFTAWMQFKDEVYRGINYMVRPRSPCIKKDKILLTEKVHTKTVEADLLPCSIQTDLLNFQIYVANDHFTTDSAFVLEAVHANDESTYSEESVDDEIIGYKLVIHLHNIVSLKKSNEEEQL